MRVLVIGNVHLYKTPDGKYYTPTIYSYEFFQRYLNVFDEVGFLAKTKYVESVDINKVLLVSGEGLQVLELPWYQGLKEMFKNIFKLIQRYRKACDGYDCYIFRVAQIESYFTYILGNMRGKPYAVEVVNDPSSFIDIKGIFKWIYIQMLKRMVKRANGAAYVTKSFLQQMYPSTARLRGNSDKYFESNYSSIEITLNDIRRPKTYIDTKTNFEIIHVANSINSNAKGHKTFIEVLKIVADCGYNITGCCIGDGSSIPEFKKYAEKLGISDRLSFIGRLHSKEEILERLSESNLMVFPTYTEGLPRCVIEAQAVGLPCISTPVCGIPELLEDKYMFEPDDSQGFAKEIMHLIENPEELEVMSYKNVEVAKRYTTEKLAQRRNHFYKKLRELAEANK